MKTASVLFAAAVFAFASVSCDKHSFESTKVLHEGMHQDHGHGDAHHDEAKKDSHGTKPPAAAPAHGAEAKH